jgi:hypothetical protein
VVRVGVAMHQRVATRVRRSAAHFGHTRRRAAS